MFHTCAGKSSRVTYITIYLSKTSPYATLAILPTTLVHTDLTDIDTCRVVFM